MREDQQDYRKPRGRRDGPNRRNQNDDDGRPFKKRFIKKNNDRQGGRGRKFDHREDRDLDRELRDYWITKKGG